MTSPILVFLSFAAGAVAGHLLTRRIGQQDLFHAHQGGLYQGRSEQACRIEFLQRRVTHLEAAARRFASPAGVNWSRKP